MSVKSFFGGMLGALGVLVIGLTCFFGLCVTAFFGGKAEMWQTLGFPAGVGLLLMYLGVKMCGKTLPSHAPVPDKKEAPAPSQTGLAPPVIAASAFAAVIAGGLLVTCMAEDILDTTLGRVSGFCFLLAVAGIFFGLGLRKKEEDEGDRLGR